MLEFLVFGPIQDLGDSFESPKLRGAMVSAIVTDLDGKVLFEHNADQRVMPASNEKLFTCAFALAKKGPSFRTKTRFWFDSNGVTVASEGDPTLPSAKLNEFRSKYRVTSKQTISLFQAYKNDRIDTWQIGDAPNRFAPAIHAFSVDKGGFELQAGPNGLSFTPHTPVLNTLRFTPSSGALKLNYDPLASRLVLSGKLPASRQRIDTLSDPDPSQTAAGCLVGSKTPLIQTISSAPAKLPNEVVESPPVSTLIKDCLQPSDNCLAEHLLFIGSGASTYPAAQKSITAWLKGTVGLDATYFRCEDGSGLSRKNQTTARNVSKLLQWTYKQPTSQLWQDSLARAGVGTLANRLKSVNFIGKTGTLDMVSALSGFVKCKDGDIRIVSVILNHYGCTESEARDIIDRFIENVSN
jgi:D-alanyl-D-alanine carboxypeptidase/D-alanyl-D-alanine-endopeptidase (penicillin-binding protein 4)